MRLQYAIVLFAGVLSISADSASTSDFAELTRSLTTNQYDGTSTRFLRVESITDEDDEGRGIKDMVKSIPGADKISALLTKQKLARYLKKDKDIGVVFTKLNLAKNADTLFENPKFLAWVKYVDDFNMKQKDPEKAVSLLPTLTKEFGDAKLARMSDTAAKSKSATTKRLAERLQDQQLKSWKNADLPVDDVFRKLDLNNGLDDILTNPLFLTFNKYLVDFNTWNPSKSTTMVETLARNYGDAKVSKMLEAATKVDDTSAMATRLQAQQREVWKDMGSNIDDVYSSILHLDSTAGNLFENPNFAVWTKFVDDFSGGRTSTFDALWKTLGEETLVQKLFAARQTREKDDTIRELQDDLILKWLSLKKPPADVAKLFGNSLEGKTLAIFYKRSSRNNLHSSISTIR